MAIFVGTVVSFLAFLTTVASQPEPYIWAGTPAEIEDYPFMASVQIADKHSCGGSILSTSVILTAAHCLPFNMLYAYSVVVGSTRFSEGTIYDVNNIRRHPKFDADSGEFDIALIQLAIKLVLGPTVQPGTCATNRPAPGTEAIAIGWGDYNAENKTSPYLRQTVLQIEEQIFCLEAFRRNPAGIELTNVQGDQLICAVNWDGVNMCAGDSGGPLIANQNGIDVILGVLRGGWCGKVETSIFMSVPFFNEWLKKQVRSLEI